MMDIELARFNMVEQQIRPCNINNKLLIELLFKLKREKFVPKGYEQLAFADIEIPLPGGQKMLQPRVEALLIQYLDPHKSDKILEIGTGSGYITALLGSLADFVYSLELDAKNSQLAIHNLTYAGINNVSVIKADAVNGLAKTAPYDKIFVGCGLNSIPTDLKDQLKIGGKMIAITGNKPIMHAVLVERISEEQFIEKKLFETNLDLLINNNKEQFKF